MAQKKYIVKDAEIGEISSVDFPAQSLAVALITKRDEKQEMCKLLFTEALARIQLEEKVHELWEQLWMAESALRDSVYSIIDSVDKYPDPVATVLQTLAQYSELVLTLTQRTEEELSKKDPSGEAKETPMSQSQSTTPDVTAEIAKRDATIVSLESELAKHKALGQLSDTEKTFFKSLQGADADNFLSGSAEYRAAEIAKSKDSDPVVYTSTSGEVFRKSDDARMVNIVKQNDELLKAQREQAKITEQMTFEKKAADMIPNLKGSIGDKGLLLKSVYQLPENKQEAVLEILKAADGVMAIGLKSTPGATSHEGDLTKSDSAGKLQQMAKALQKVDPSLDYYAAYSKVMIENPELTAEALKG